MCVRMGKEKDGVWTDTDVEVEVEVKSGGVAAGNKLLLMVNGELRGRSFPEDDPRNSA